MVLKNLKLFPWQPIINRATLTNIGNKDSKIKETTSVQSKIRNIKYLLKINQQEVR